MKTYLLYLENKEELWFDHIGIYYSNDDAYNAAIIYIIDEVKQDIYDNNYLHLYNDVLNLFVDGEKKAAIIYYNDKIVYPYQIYTCLKIKEFEIQTIEGPKITKNFALKLSTFK